MLNYIIKIKDHTICDKSQSCFSCTTFSTFINLFYVNNYKILYECS